MKILGYIGLGLISYLIFMVLLFPAAPVVDRLALAPASLTGVSGPLWSGKVDTVEFPNDSMPTGPDMFEIENVSWRVAPLKLLTGAGATNIDFEAYGGTGEGLIAQSFTGTTSIEDFTYEAEGKSLSVLLEPFAKIGGVFTINVANMQMLNQQPESLEATIIWKNASLVEPLIAKLGDMELTIKPVGEKHVAKISSNGGQLDIDGSADIEKNGDFKSNIVIKPKQGAPQVVVDMLRGIARPSSDGSYKIRRTGNINRLM